MGKLAQNAVPDPFVRFYLGFMWIGAITAFLIPLVVGISYHLLGWQVAVLLLPFSFWGFVYSQKSGSRGEGTIWRKPLPLLGLLLRLIFILGSVAVPLIAVLLDTVEIMRLWAYAIAIPVGVNFGYGSEGIKQSQLGGEKLPPARQVRFRIALGGAFAIAFILLSEAIWHSAPLGAWIWFHAFGVLFAIVIFMLLTVIATEMMPSSPDIDVVKRGLPETKLDEGARKAFAFLHRSAIGSRNSYPSPDLEQSKLIIKEIDWAREYRQNLEAGIEPNDRKFSNIQILLSPSDIIQFTSDGENTVSVFISQRKDPEGWKLIGDFVCFDATKVPGNLISRILDLVWLDDRRGLRELLEPYDTNQETR